MYSVQSVCRKLPCSGMDRKHAEGFVDVKTALVSAPALGLPDNMQPFQLYIRERGLLEVCWGRNACHTITGWHITDQGSVQ